MLQAVLLCLSGYDSPHIRIIKEKSKYTSLERKKIKFTSNACTILGINASEKQILEEILILGIHIKDLQAFIKHNQVINGLYVMTLCHGIRQLIDEYKQQIILFRRQYGICPLAEQSISVCRIQKNFKKYENLFECISTNLCQEIMKKHLFGGKILGALLDLVTLNGGVPFIKSKLNKLLKRILFVWYNQMTSFVAYGILSDSYSEFFIKQNKTYSSERLGGTQKYELLSWNNQFLINYSMLPLKHIPNHIVDKILFIGKAVRILNAFKYKKETTTTNANTLASTMPHSDDDDDDEKTMTTTTTCSFTHNGMNLMLTEEEMFVLSANLHKLKMAKNKNENFNVHELESVLNKIKNQIAHKLWAVLVFHLKLKQHLQTLRDYFLLGNGRFWQCLLDECANIPALETIPVTVASRDLNVGPFKTAAAKSDDETTTLTFLELVALQFSLSKFSTRRKTIDLDKICVNASCVKMNRKNDLLLQFKYEKYNHGSCWMKLKVPIRYGFDTRFNFAASPHAQSFAFVLQHDRINWWLHHTHANDPFGADICVNSLVIGIVNEIKKQKICLFAVDENGSKQMIESSDVYSDCFDGKLHSFAIIFCHLESEIKVTIDDELVLFANQFGIEKFVKTEIGTGRAWVGLTSSCSLVNCKKESISIDILQWSFCGKFQFETTAFEHNLDHFERGGGGNSWKHAMKFWSRINLEYNICNPMDVIFDEYDLERYNALFRFLLLLKRAHCQINKCWKQISIQIKRKRHLSSSPIWLFILSISRRMLFFVNNLQFYIQFEVIDIEYKALLKQIEGTKNIEFVMEAHQKFLHSLCRQCFVIGNEQLWTYVTKILCLLLQTTALILDYCGKERLFDGVMDMAQNEKYQRQFEKQIEVLSNSFDSSLSQWFELAKTVSLHQQSLFKLQRLVSQLNYNNWFM